MADNETPIQRLRAAGFQLAGEWKIEADELRCVLKDFGSSTNVLYAFVESDNVLYIGKSARSLKQQLYGYQKPGHSQSTNIKANRLIRQTLKDQRRIAVYVFVDPGDLRFGGFQVNLAAGLLDSLKVTLKPPWNKVGI